MSTSIKDAEKIVEISGQLDDLIKDICEVFNLRVRDMKKDVRRHDMVAARALFYGLAYIHITEVKSYLAQKTNKATATVIHGLGLIQNDPMHKAMKQKYYDIKICKNF